MKTENGPCCEKMRAVLESGESALTYIPKFREYGIEILDGGSSFIVITHCPWCGCVLPASLRERWFNELEALGLSFPEDELPSEFLDDRWWRNRAIE